MHNTNTIEDLDGFRMRAKPAPRTPWGTPDSVDLVTEGIWHISCPGHGGLFLSPLRIKVLPQCVRDYAAYWAKGFGPQWFEEDCAAGLVLLAFGADMRANWTREAAAQIADGIAAMLERKPHLARLVAWCRRCVEETAE